MKLGYIWGLLAGALSAVCYGMNPLGALPLYAEGVTPAAALMYRFGFAAAMLGAWMLARRESFRLTRAETALCVPLGFLFAVSSLTFYESMKIGT